jgi:hypothetical protein
LPGAGSCSQLLIPVAQYRLGKQSKRDTGIPVAQKFMSDSDPPRAVLIFSYQLSSCSLSFLLVFVEIIVDVYEPLMPK